jgi:hypothetical protein
MKSVIDEHRPVDGVEPICHVLQIAPSTYDLHAARRADPEQRSVRTQRDEVLMAQIQRVWEENGQVYGVCRVPCNYIPKRSYPLFQAREALRTLSDELRATKRPLPPTPSPT